MAETITREVPGLSGITEEVWSKEVLEATPVTKAHLGGLVWIAGKVKTSKDYLIGIKQPGEPGFPEGGFITRETGVAHLTNHPPEAVRAFPPKKKRGRKPKKAVVTKESPKPAISVKKRKQKRRKAP